MTENMNEEIVLTKEGYDKIVAEHEELVSVKRAEVAERIKESISYGDISENAEYEGDVVNVGLKVLVKDLDLGIEEEFSIVGATEADPFEGKISNESSVGHALIGHKKGDKVAVEVPDGIINYEVVDIIKA